MIHQFEQIESRIAVALSYPSHIRKGFGVRQEYRITLTLFKQLLADPVLDDDQILTREPPRTAKKEIEENNWKHDDDVKKDWKAMRSTAYCLTWYRSKYSLVIDMTKQSIWLILRDFR